MHRFEVFQNGDNLPVLNSQFNVLIRQVPDNVVHRIQAPDNLGLITIESLPCLFEVLTFLVECLVISRFRTGFFHFIEAEIQNIRLGIH